MLTRRTVLALPITLAAASRAGVVRAQTADTAALRAALELEHEAVHTFGEVGARLDEATKELVRELDADHRRQRDRLVDELRAVGEEPPAARPAYALPLPVTDRTSGIDVLLVIEEALVRAYATAVRTAARPGHRSLSAELMARCAAHQTSLRFARSRSLTAATQAFPGT